MKGIVFVELLEMIEESYGYEVVNHVLENTDLDSKGIYTSTGTYKHEEAIKITTGACEYLGINSEDFLLLFGEYLFGSLVASYPTLIAGFNDPFQLLESIEGYIYVEVKKLYPEAELPTFECSRPNFENELHMVYSSIRHLDTLCEGLIRGCFNYFEVLATVKSQTLPGGKTLFVITRHDI